MGRRIRSGFCLSILVVLLTGLSLSSSYAQTRGPKNVQVALRAKWPGTSLLLEAGELLSNHWKDLYWEFTELWLLKSSEESGSQTAKDCLKTIVNCGKSLLTEPLASVFEFSLTLRSASPRLALYQQLAENCLSSFPLGDEYIPSLVNEGEFEPNNHEKHQKANSQLPDGKCCWVDTGAALYLDANELQQWLKSPNRVDSDKFQQPELFEFDHVHPDSSIGSPAAILYGAPGMGCFRELHTILVDSAKQGKVTYVVRPLLLPGCDSKIGRCGAIGTRDPLNLGGYGVELALKNMEYKAMDDSVVRKGVTLEDPHTEDLSQDVRGFIFSRILERKPELTSEIMAFRDSLLSSTVSDTLDVWELKDLGHQTAQRIVHASDPLQSMQEINQNFPSVVSSLSRMKLNDSIKDEILSNQRMIPPGKSLLALNGALLNLEDIDLHMLIDMVHQELSLADQYLQLKVPSATVRKFLAILPPSENNMIRIDFRSEHVHYINNLEVDAMYKRWRNNLHEILMPAFPGQMRYIRKNIFHAVYVLDPASICGLKTIDMVISSFENNLPMRFGVILYSRSLIQRNEAYGDDLQHGHVEDNHRSEDISSLVIRLFLYVKENHGDLMAFQFLSNINKLRLESDGEETPEMHHVEGAFVETLLPSAKIPPQNTLLKLLTEKAYEELSQESSMFVSKLGLAKLQCCLLMNGLVHEASEEALSNSMNDELPRIQEQVYYGLIDSHTDILDKLLMENAIKRYNPQIITSGKFKPKYVSLSALMLENGSWMNEISYLHSSESVDDIKPVTQLLVIDVTSKKGVKLLREGLHYMMGGSKIARLGVAFSSNKDVRLSSYILMKVFEIAASAHSYKGGVLSFLDQVCSLYEKEYIGSPYLDNESIQVFINKVIQLAAANHLPSSRYETSLSVSSAENFTSHLKKVTQFLFRKLGLEDGVNAVITNGRVVPVRGGDVFVSHDFLLLESLEFKQRIQEIAEIIEEVKWEDIDPDLLTSKFISDIILSISSSIAVRDRNSETARFEVLSSTYSAVILENENSSIHIDAVIDPLSSSGQKLSSLLRFLWKYIQPSMRLVLNPMSSLVDLPLKNYYRYVVPTLDDFSNTDDTVYGPKAFFANMPLSKTLTMNLDVPERWLVEPVIAIHDLDNILLEKLGDERTLQAVFELEALILTGHCSEKDHEPPQGLQLILGTKSSPHLVDTLVMSNLGYWQMKVSPGVWYLQLAPGRSSELYNIKEDSDGSGSLSRRIMINDLRGKPVYLEVVKKKGKESEKLLISSEDGSHSMQKEKEDKKSWNSNILKWASGLISGGDHSKKIDRTSGEDGSTRRHGKTINIFSVASGHLYERFLKIMILSVLKNTNRPVKFWFIKNYLSPQFKDVIPHMARDYDFEYELITYKWPTWLHKQKEKQRIIWAYKILFLDVIFPLALEKVIFVDADQIIRTDMGELYDMNLRGRPLAYTPFCDNNKDMDGFRFWKQGFWKEHLRGRPYHISALYVVDLAKFRETAAGDQLRVIYETLSKDPNSLSNLDQDLPNYAQHSVPIFSLPQEWLWCESWCGNATKAKAKTIDLCNNPQTKEPKLQGARRIVAEWPDLDLEARQYTSKILGEPLSPQEQAVPPPEPKSLPIDSEDWEAKSEL